MIETAMARKPPVRAGHVWGLSPFMSCGHDSAMSEAPRWWAFRRAQSLRPATYTCPFCGELLHAMSEHVVLAPEGDVARRRHAHSACVLTERRAGRLPTRDELG